ncbi:UDP-glucosyltransferase 2-like [Palaemon carinicauda]|uniref:UDP-glucosyltransferase 2-like n=1 Tax=Palaemon carinicauda TaxID=392227 RepID=UPI0035B69199
MKVWWLPVVLVCLLSLNGRTSASLASGGKETSPRSYKVLVLGPVGSRSLYHLTRSLSEALGDAGHSVILLSTFGPSSTHPNIKEIPTGAPVEILEDYDSFEIRSIVGIFKWHTSVVKHIGRAMWTNENIINLWERRDDFDAIILIGYGNEIALPFLMDYNGTYINLCTPGAEIFTLSQHGNWLPLSVVPSLLLPFDENMSFYERVINPFVVWMSSLVYLYSSERVGREVIDEFFPDMPPISELHHSSRLTLINGHFAMDGPVPLLPTQVEIGTINARPPNPLPKDLEDFARSSGDAGVIYFSLGSLVRSKNIPPKHKEMFLEAFSRLPQKVIWKYEEGDIDLPPNVITRSWLPQQDILGHPKTRLFISHCGNLGTQEAKYHGVPVLGVPVLFDQPRNAARMARKGFGLVLNWDDMTTETIFNAIQTILHNPSFADKLKQVSEALKDQKETPRERAVWWVEYAIRHNGRNASYLNYPGRKLHFLQYVGVDVAAIWIAFLLLWTMLCYRICLKLCGCFCKDKRSEQKEKVS